MRRRATATLIAIGLLAGACGSEPNPGDIGAFCELLGDGVGAEQALDDPVAFDALNRVAPPDIRPAIEQLRVAALELDELSDSDLEGLFAARFNPGTTEARAQLDAYAVSTCGLSLSNPDVDTTRTAAFAREIDAFLEVAAAGRPWLDQVEVIPAIVDDSLHSVRAVFVAEPADAAHADEVCAVLSAHLYGQQNAAGNVTVDFDGVVLSQRQGVEGVCG